MTITAELLSVLKTLPRDQKLLLVQFLVAELATEEGVTLLEEGTTYEVWLPHDSHEAAHK